MLELQSTPLPADQSQNQEVAVKPEAPCSWDGICSLQNHQKVGGFNMFGGVSPSIGAMIFNHHLAQKPIKHCTSVHLSQWHGNRQVKSRIDPMVLTSQPMSHHRERDLRCALSHRFSYESRLKPWLCTGMHPTKPQTAAEQSPQ